MCLTCVACAIGWRKAAPAADIAAQAAWLAAIRPASRASCAARSAGQAQSRIDLLRAAPCPKVSAARTAARGRWSPRCSSSKIGNTGHAQAAAKRAIARISSIPSGMVTGASGTAQPLRSRALSGRGNGTRVLRRSSSLVSVGDHTDRPPGHRIERRLGQSAAVSRAQHGDNLGGAKRREIADDAMLHQADAMREPRRPRGVPSRA